MTQAANGAAPQDTVSAALNIAQLPTQNVSKLLGLASSISPFQPTVTAAADWTLGITYNTGNSPISLAVDAAQNVWVANFAANTIAKISRTGGVASFAPAGTSAPGGIAVAPNGNIWFTNSGNNSVEQMTPAGTAVTGAPYTGGSMSHPRGIAFDIYGNAIVSSYDNLQVTTFDATGTLLGTTSYQFQSNKYDGGGTPLISRQ